MFSPASNMVYHNIYVEIHFTLVASGFEIISTEAESHAEWVSETVPRLDYKHKIDFFLNSIQTTHSLSLKEFQHFSLVLFKNIKGDPFYIIHFPTITKSILMWKELNWHFRLGQTISIKFGLLIALILVTPFGIRWFILRWVYFLKKWF